MLFPVSSAQGNLIFALPVIPEHDPGGSKMLGFCEPTGEGDCWGRSVATVGLGERVGSVLPGPSSSEKPWECCWRGGGSFWGAQAGNLLLSGGASRCRQRLRAEPVCSSLGHPSAPARHRTEMLAALVLPWGHRGCRALHPRTSTPGDDPAAWAWGGQGPGCSL